MFTADTKPAPARRRVRLHPTVFAPRIARRMLHKLGDPADVPQRLVDDAALVVSELVADSIRQCRHDVEVDIQLANQQIVVRVFDAQAKAPLFSDRTGKVPARSSATVQHLAASWGCSRYQYGWEVWAVLRSASAEPLHDTEVGIRCSEV